MRYKELRSIVEYLKGKKYLHDIERVDDNLLRAVLDKEEIFFDLNRSKNLIYKRDDFIKTKFYNAPFDKVLAKRCKKSFIENIELDPNDKIVRIECLKKGSYKQERSILQLEFTGRHSNAIILDEEGKVLEALHHDFHRDIKPGRPLFPLQPPKALDKGDFEIEDIQKYLLGRYDSLRHQRLNVLKSAKALHINKQIQKLQDLLENLEKEEDLEKEADMQERFGNIVLSNLHRIKPYQEKFEGEDFEGNDITIQLPKEAKTPAHAADIFFARAKKFRQKAKNIHIQRENLQEKIAFLQKKLSIVQNAKRPEEIEMLFPKQAKIGKRSEKNYERLQIDGYPVFVGKNRQGNIELLKKAKASDIWLHLKDMPSAHVIVSTNKQNVPSHVLQSAAKLCAQFSVKHPGTYKVDYTQRRNVKPKDGANVEYVKYKTIPVTIE